MTLEELLRKNEKAHQKRAKTGVVKPEIIKNEPVESTIKEEKKEIIEDEPVHPIDSEKGKKENKTEAKKPVSSSSKASKKPQNRAYMVVEDIEKVNEE